MARIISVLSGKGGVGKTTLVSNLGTALVKRGKKVTILDANVTTPNLSLHLGIPLYPVTLHDVLRDNISIEAATYDHHTGLKVVPASLSTKALRGIDMSKLESALSHLVEKNDIIIVDSAAGLGEEALTAIDVADDLIVVTNPELPAVTDALKTIKMAQEAGTNILGVVVNRVKGLNHEMSMDEIRSMLEVPIISIIPEDVHVPKSISKKTPVVHHKPRSRSSIQFQKLASRILGETYYGVKKKSWLERLFFWWD